MGIKTEQKGYRIEDHKYGVVVYGTIPVDDLVALTKVWSKRGLNQMALGVSSALGANLAVCREGDIEKWELEINDKAKKSSGGDDELKWLRSTDTGTSSLTIFSVLSELHGVAALARTYGADIPHDPDDFGRCYRLIERFPHWRNRLSEVSDRFPIWKPFVETWEQLEALWKAESPSGKCPQLYKKIKELLNEGKDIKEIALELGFNHINNFRRFVKKITGKVPSKLSEGDA